MDQSCLCTLGFGFSDPLTFCQTFFFSYGKIRLPVVGQSALLSSDPPAFFFLTGIETVFFPACRRLLFFARHMLASFSSQLRAFFLQFDLASSLISTDLRNLNSKNLAASSAQSVSLAISPLLIK